MEVEVAFNFIYTMHYNELVVFFTSFFSFKNIS
jgi:hypothetical protein